ncbi:MAG TPA: hypothetical protein VLT47_10930 [Anaeromyxobacteraceae bacterium]|nr:hypothetical protein [Anaeromyxobacteraceae bacterium]
MKGSFVAARLEDVAPFAAGPDGAALQVAMGDDQNAAIEGLEDAAKMSSPFLCPDDALDLLGATFGLPRYPGEANGTAPLGDVAGTGYRGRLCIAWQTWRWAGTPTAVLLQLQTYAPGADFAILTDSNGTWTLPPSGSVAQTDVGLQDTSYLAKWYSRFDVRIGPNFGPLAVSQPVVLATSATTTASFTMPIENGSVSVTVDNSGSFAFGQVIYIGQAGYFEVTSAGAGTIVLTNLGGAAAACEFSGLVAGTMGSSRNAVAGTVIASGQHIVAAQYLPPGGANVSIAMIVGQSRIGTHLAVPDQREALKAIILRWKAPHAYAGRMQLLWQKLSIYPSDNAAAGFYWGFDYIGRMVGLNMWTGQTVGGYDRS